MLSEVVGVLEGRMDVEELIFATSALNLEHRDPIEILVQAAAAVWVKAKLPSGALAELERRRGRAEAASLRWFAAQAADLLAALAGKAKGARPRIEGARLAGLGSRRERWAETLRALVDLASAEKPAKPGARAPKAESDHRLAWIVRKSAFPRCVCGSSRGRSAPSTSRASAPSIWW